MGVEGVKVVNNVSYYHNYISKNYPNYKEALTLNEYNNIVNKIHWDDFLKTRSLDTMKQGAYDEYIAHMFEEFAEEKFSARVANYEDFRKYVELLISQKNPELDENFFKELSRKLTLDIVVEELNANQVRISDPNMYVVYASRLLAQYDKIIAEYREIARQHVISVVEKNRNNMSDDIQMELVEKVLNEFSIEEVVNYLNENVILEKYNNIFNEEIHTNPRIRKYYFDVARKLVLNVVNAYGKELHDNSKQYFVDEIINSYNINDIISGLNGSNILEKYRKLYNSIEQQIKSQVVIAHSQAVPVPINVTLETLQQEILEHTLMLGRYNVNDVILGKNVEQLKLYCSNRGNTYEEVNVKQVVDYILSEIDEFLKDKKSNSVIKNYIFNMVLDKLKGVSPERVINHFYDKTIKFVCIEAMDDVNYVRPIVDKVLNSERLNFGSVGKLYILRVILEKYKNEKMYSNVVTSRLDVNKKIRTVCVSLINGLNYVQIQINRFLNKESNSYYDKELRNEMLAIVLKGIDNDSKMSIENVISNDYDDKIRVLCENARRKINSRKINGIPVRISHNTKIRRMRQSIVSLVLVGTLAVGGLAATLGFVKNASDAYTDVKYSMAFDNLEELGLTSRSVISSSSSENFDEAVDDVIKFYNECQTKGITSPEFISLGFNLAKTRVNVEPERVLEIMDSLLSRVQSKVRNNDDLDELRDDIDSPNFISYMYRELKQMACKQMDYQEYKALLSAYRNAEISAIANSESSAFSLLTPEQQQLAYDLMDLYDQYTKDSVIKVTKLLEGDNIMQTLLSILMSSNEKSDTNGKGGRA